MTLNECYTKYEGTSILVPGGGAGNDGQCAQWSDTVLHEVYGFPYIYTPNAKDWWYNADSLGLSQHFDKITDGSIKAGDFVVYDPINSSDPQGHIDVAAQDGVKSNYVGYDSNWGGAAYYKNGYPILHTVTHADSYNKFILGSLRLKGGNMPLAPEDEFYKQIGLGVSRSKIWETVNTSKDGAVVGQNVVDVTGELYDYKASHPDNAPSNVKVLEKGNYEVK